MGDSVDSSRKCSALRTFCCFSLVCVVFVRIAGFAVGSTKVGWLAVSEDRYTVSNSGTAFRVGTAVARIGKEAQFLSGVDVGSSVSQNVAHLRNVEHG